MEQNCQNCSNIITENFCSACGQKKYKRIDRKYIWDEMQYTMLHANKGFFYSVKNILRNPGKTAREFIEGNRVNHYKPILLAFLLSGISAFISFKIIGLNEIMGTYYSSQHMNSEFMNDYMTFSSSYSSIIMLLLIPIFAVLTKIAFWKWGHNYHEHVVMNAYILSFYLLFNILILYPLMYIFKNDVSFVVPMASFSMVTIPFILTWFFKKFYSDRPLKSIIGRVLITLGLTVFSSILLMIFAVIGGFIYAMINGPESMNYMIPK